MGRIDEALVQHSLRWVDAVEETLLHNSRTSPGLLHQVPVVDGRLLKHLVIQAQPLHSQWQPPRQQVRRNRPL